MIENLNEIYKYISNIEKKLEKKISNIMTLITTKISLFDNKNIELEKNQKEFLKNLNFEDYKKVSNKITEIFNILNLNENKNKEINNNLNKIQNKSISHEIRIEKIEKKFFDFETNFSQLLIKDSLPGIIGKYSKFKNRKDFFNFLYENVNKLNNFKDKNDFDIKIKKIENQIKIISFQIEQTNKNFSKENLKIINEKKDEIDKKIFEIENSLIVIKNKLSDENKNKFKNNILNTIYEREKKKYQNFNE